MELAGFLSYHGITLDEIVEQAKATLRLSPDDALFVCGSVVEGLGNEKSDLDLFLITSRKNIPFTSLNDVLLIIGRCAVDVCVVQHSAVEELVKKFNDWASLPREPRNTIAFTDEERKLLHRLRSGLALYGRERFEQIRDQIKFIDLARHRLDTAQHFASNLQVDLAGLRSAGDQYSLLFCAQELLGHTVDALLAAHKYTNPHWKWRIRQLSDLPSEWDVELPGRRTGVSARDLYLKLHSTPRSTSLSDILSHALRIVAFSRRVFPWATYRLLSPSLPPLQAAHSDHTATGVPLPNLDVDVIVRYRDEKFELLRLQGEGEIFSLSPKEYSLLCLFDGETPKEYAISEAETLSNKKVGREFLQQMLALVRHGDFEARSGFDQQALSTILSSRSN